MNENRDSVVYIGDRAATAIEYQQRRWIFHRDRSLSVPDAFAALLLKSGNFVRADDVGRTVEERFPAGGLLLFRRWGALGDLIMFRAATAAYRRVHPEARVVLRCQDRFGTLFTEDPVWMEISPIGHPPRHQQEYAGVCSFDQVAEADHRGARKHRAQLFWEAMSKRTIAILPDDWKVPVPLAADQYVHRHLENRGLLRGQRDRPLVGLQVRGSGSMKSLPQSVMQDVIRRILGAGAAVMLIEPLRDVAEPFCLTDAVYEMTHRDALHGISLMRHCDLCVTMDSGALWMTHCAPCPVLAILGPTRPEQRISFHPFFPARARAVCLNELINCPACFEAAHACGGTFSCMQRQPDWKVVVDTISRAVEEMLGLVVPLPLAGV